MFDPTDFNDVADLAGVAQRAQMLRAMKERSGQATARSSERRYFAQCPYCGGGLVGKFEKCMSCSSLLKWTDGVGGAGAVPAKTMKCPACLGQVQDAARRCMHCTTAIVWVEKYPCVKGEEEAFRQKRLPTLKAQEDKELRRREQVKAEAAQGVFRCINPKCGKPLRSTNKPTLCGKCLLKGETAT